MGRWKPPTAQGTALVTPQGHARLKAELDDLWRVRRPEVVAALSAAAAEGDRSENAEYIYRKKQLAEIDRRVRYLGKRIPELRVVREPPGDPRAVYFGATCTLEAEDGSERRCRLVGPDETDGARGDISIDSPIARALLGRRVDDEIVAQLPAGPARYVVLEVVYEGMNGGG